MYTPHLGTGWSVAVANMRRGGISITATTATSGKPARRSRCANFRISKSSMQKKERPIREEIGRSNARERVVQTSIFFQLLVISASTVDLSGCQTGITGSVNPSAALAHRDHSAVDQLYFLSDRKFGKLVLIDGSEAAVLHLQANDKTGRSIVLTAVCVV